VAGRVFRAVGVNRAAIAHCAAEPVRAVVTAAFAVADAAASVAESRSAATGQADLVGGAIGVCIARPGILPVLKHVQPRVPVCVVEVALVKEELEGVVVRAQ
jgi:hypothetical protein